MLIDDSCDFFPFKFVNFLMCNILQFYVLLIFTLYLLLYQFCLWLLYIIHVTGSFKDIFPSFLLKVSLTQGHENYGVFFKWLFQLKKILNYLRCYILSFVLSVTWATWQFTSSIPLGLFSSLLSSTLYIVLIWNCALGLVTATCWFSFFVYFMYHIAG